MLYFLHMYFDQLSACRLSVNVLIGVSQYESRRFNRWNRNDACMLKDFRLLSQWRCIGLLA